MSDRTNIYKVLSHIYQVKASSPSDITSNTDCNYGEVCETIDHLHDINILITIGNGRNVFMIYPGRETDRYLEIFGVI